MGEKKSKGIRVCAVGFTGVFLIAGLTGCRDSTAFTRNVYNQESPESVDGNMMENEEDNEETREDIFSVAEQESESLRDYDRSIAQYGESEEDNDAEAYDVSYNAGADDFYTSGNTTDSDDSSLEEGLESTGGDSQSEGEDVEISYGTDGDDDGGATSDADSSIDTIDTAPSGDGTGEDDAADEDTGDDGGVTVVDPDADVTEIPTGSTVAAVGELAVMAQMLGGDGTVVATSKSFKEETVSGISAASVFSDELSDDLVYLGDIDSFSEISSSAFSDLLEADPDLIILAEEDSFTSAQTEKLEAAGTEIVYIDDMSEGSGASSTASDHLLYNLEVVAKALDDRTEYGGQDAEKVYAAYEEWYDEIMDDAETDSTLYTCYFSIYDDDVRATYSYSYANKSITFDEGIPIAPMGSYLAVGDYLGSAGVTPTNVKTANMGYFTTSNKAELIYFQPYVALIEKTVTGGLYESGLVGWFTGNGNANTYNNPYPLSKASSSIFLGNAGYPALLTSTQYITEQIEDSKGGKGLFSGYYDTEYFDYAYGDSIVTIESTDYDVYTVPHGVCSWVDGSAESPLLTAWASAKFYETYTDDELKSYVQEFYEEFYRYDLSGTEAKTILAGLEE